MSQDTSVQAELIAVNQKLLSAIAAGDWKTYAELCDPTLSAFEAESGGHLVEGMEFHRFYFNLGGAKSAVNNTICSPHVRVMGDVAVVSYVRVVQRLDESGKPVTFCGQETRVWQRQSGAWRHVHFHRSA